MNNLVSAYASIPAKEASPCRSTRRYLSDQVFSRTHRLDLAAEYTGVLRASLGTGAESGAECCKPRSNGGNCYRLIERCEQMAQIALICSHIFAIRVSVCSHLICVVNFNFAPQDAPLSGEAHILKILFRDIEGFLHAVIFGSARAPGCGPVSRTFPARGLGPPLANCGPPGLGARR